MKKTKLTTTIATVLLLFTIIILTGCADVEQVEKCFTGHTYGFWGGVWHGMIASLSFIGSLFSDDIAVYALNNNGGWYDFGFVFGIGGIIGLLKLFANIVNSILN